MRAPLRVAAKRSCRGVKGRVFPRDRCAVGRAPVRAHLERHADRLYNELAGPDPRGPQEGPPEAEAGKRSFDTMFERFTERARKVMALANQEAQRFNHEYIGTEHVLLGLVKEGSGVGANVLKNLGVDLAKVRMEVVKLVKAGPDMVTMGKLP